MAKKLTNIYVYRASGYGKTGGDEIQVGGSNDLRPHLEAFPVIAYKLGEMTTCRFDVNQGSPWVAERILSIRHRLYLVYDDGTQDAFRVTEIASGASGFASVSVEAVALWADLGDQLTFYRDRLVFPIATITFDDALDIIFDTTEFGTQYRKNTVQASLASLDVALDLNNTTRLQALYQLADMVKLTHGVTVEFEAAYQQAVNEHYLNFYEEVGWSAAERTAGAADPSLRPIQGPTGNLGSGRRNRLELDVADAQDSDFYTRLFPFAGPDDYYKGIGGTLGQTDTEIGAYLQARSVTYRAGSDLSDFVWAQDIVWDTNAWAGYRIWRILWQPVGSNPLFLSNGAVVRTEAPNKFVLSGNLVAGSSDYVLIDPDVQRFATYLRSTDYDVLGNVDRAVRWEDLPPARNDLPAKFNEIDSNMSGPWSGPPTQKLPVGWNAYPTTPNAVVTAEVTGDDVYYGTKQLKVTCPVGQGVVTDRFATAYLNPNNPAYSMWAGLRVDVGTTVKLELVDGQGTSWPTGTVIAESNSTALRALSVGGMEPIKEGVVSATVRFLIRITVSAATGSTGTFYLDSVAAMSSPIPYEYATEMGQTDLLLRAAEEMSRSSGLQGAAMRASAIDLSEDDASYEAIEIGSHVSLEDFFVAGTGWKLSTTGRVTELEVDTHPLEGFRKLFNVVRTRPTLQDRFVPTVKKRPLEEAPLQTTEASESVPTGSDVVVDAAVPGLSGLIHDHGWLHLEPGETQSDYIQVRGGKPIAKGILTVEQVTNNLSGSDQWTVTNRNIAHDVFRIDKATGVPNAQMQEYKWGWIYPGDLPAYDCDWYNVDGSDLVLQHDFEERYGQVVHDLRRWGLNAHVGWSTAYTGSGEPRWTDYGLQFNVASGHQLVRNPLSADKWGNTGSAPYITGSDWTIVWVGTPDPVSTGRSYHYALGNPSNLDANWFLYSGSDKFYFGYETGVGRKRGSFSTGSEWHMGTYVNSGSVNTFYLDRGVVAAQFTSASDPFESPTAQLTLGADTNEGSGFTGQMGYFLVYRSAKTQEEVQAIFDVVNCIMQRRGISLPTSFLLQPAPNIVWEMTRSAYETNLTVPTSIADIVWEPVTIDFGLSLPYAEQTEFLLLADNITVNDGSEIVTWVDQSDNGHDFGGSTERPTYRATGGRGSGPAVDWGAARSWLDSLAPINIGSQVVSLFYRAKWTDIISWTKLLDTRDGVDGVYLHVDSGADLNTGDSVGNLVINTDYLAAADETDGRWIDVGIVYDRKSFYIYGWRGHNHEGLSWFNSGSMARVADFGNNTVVLGAHYAHGDNGFEGLWQAAIMWTGVALTRDEFHQVTWYIDSVTGNFGSDSFTTGSDSVLPNIDVEVVSSPSTVSSAGSIVKTYLIVNDLEVEVVSSPSTATQGGQSAYLTVNDLEVQIVSSPSTETV